MGAHNIDFELDGHEALKSPQPVNHLLKSFPDLVPLMPFESSTALREFQIAHDNNSDTANSVHTTIAKFLKTQCKEASIFERIKKGLKGVLRRQ